MMKKKEVGYYTQEVDTGGNGDSNSMAICDYDSISNRSVTIYSMPYE
jgi:hypothetical protein